MPAWLSFTSNNRSFYANNTETGIYEIEIVAVDSQQNKQYMHFALQVFDESNDAEQFYSGTVYIAIIFSIAVAVLYFIMSFSTYLQVRSTRSVNSASINSLLGQNPFKFTDRKRKLEASQQ